MPRPEETRVLTYDLIAKTSLPNPDVDWRLDYLVRKQIPDINEQTLGASCLGLCIILRDVKSGEVVVPEEAKDQGFEEWLMSKRPEGIVRYARFEDLGFGDWW